MRFLMRCAKAVMGGLAAGVSTYYIANTDASVTSNEWQTVVVSAIAGLLLVFGVPNVDPHA